MAVWCLALFASMGARAQMSTPASGSVSPTGAFTYSIPIRIPPGTAGVQPSLALNYSSQSGNGIAGMGWNLSGLSVITRCAATLATDGVRGGVNLDANDKLCLDGQRLIVQSGTYGQPGAVYFTEIFNGSRITQIGTTPTLVWRAPSPSYTNYPLTVSYSTATMGNMASQPKSSTGNQKTTFASSNNDIEFRVETKSGELMEYARADLAASPTLPTRMWLLVRVVDSHGNYWTVDYARNSGVGEYLPTAFNYTANTVTSLAAYNKVELIYETRPDTSVAYLGGLAVSNTQRLKTIRTWATPSAGGAMQAVTEYRLTYGTSVGTGRSLLQSVQEFAADGTALNPITFTYNTAAPSFIDNSYNAFGQSDAAGWNSGWRYWAGDVNGDGRTDIITRDGNGTLGIMQGSPSGLSWLGGGTATGLSDAAGWNDGLRWWAMDVDGDGKTDIVSRAGDGTFYLFKSTDSGFAAPVVAIPASAGLSDAGGWNSGVRFFVMDVNGDGRKDLVTRASNGTLGVYLSNGSGFTFAGSTATPYVDPGWNGVERIYVGDFDGDGKDDLAFRVSEGVIGVWLSNGTGFVQTFGVATGIPDSYGTVNRVFVADVNGDGKSDLIIRDSSGAITVWLSTGKGFVQTGSVSSSYTDLVAVDSVNPDGVPVTTYVPGTGVTSSRFFVTDFNGDGRADLIIRQPSGPYELWQSTGTSFVNVGTVNLGGYTDIAGWSSGYRYWGSDATGDGKGGMIARDGAGGGPHS
jgi:hypothetical protein